jgi:RNA polymerase sigma-70 factor (ECF subfamily)
VTSTEATQALLARRPELLAYLRRRLPVGADAEDVLQSALLRASRHFGTLRDPDALAAWFFRVLRTTLVDHRRAEARAARRPEPLEPSTSMPWYEAGNCACSLACLAELSPAYADVLTRLDLREEPAARVARDLGVSENNLAVRLHRARKALRDRLKACCGCTSTEQCQRCRCATDAL